MHKSNTAANKVRRMIIILSILIYTILHINILLTINIIVLKYNNMYYNII